MVEFNACHQNKKKYLGIKLIAAVLRRELNNPKDDRLSSFAR